MICRTYVDATSIAVHIKRPSNNHAHKHNNVVQNSAYVDEVQTIPLSRVQIADDDAACVATLL